MTTRSRDPLLGLPPCPTHWWDRHFPDGWEVRAQRWETEEVPPGRFKRGWAYASKAGPGGRPLYAVFFWFVDYPDSFETFILGAGAVAVLALLQERRAHGEVPRVLVEIFEGIVDDPGEAEIVTGQDPEGWYARAIPQAGIGPPLPFVGAGKTRADALEALAKCLACVVLVRTARMTRMEKKLEGIS